MAETIWSREDGQGKQAARYNERCYTVSIVLCQTSSLVAASGDSFAVLKLASVLAER